MYTNLWAEFKDPIMENEYFCDELSRILRYFKSIVLFLVLLNFLFIIVDVIIITDLKSVFLILLNKIIFLILILLFYSSIANAKDFKAAFKLITFYMFLFVFSYLYTVSFYDNPNFLIKCFDVNIIVIGYFIIPNRWRNSVAAAVFLVCAFLLFAFFTMNVDHREFAAGSVYIIIVLILSAISSYRIQYYKRHHYISLQTLKRMSVTDSLTGIFNRLHFNLELEKSVTNYRECNLGFAIILFDIDDFKQINDVNGHITGDRILVEMVSIMKKNLRDMDVLSRWGGEEFAVLLPDATKDKAIDVAYEIRNSIQEYDFGLGQQVTCSFGVVSTEDGTTGETLLSKVDHLMYQAKYCGKNSVMFDR
ncbi:MAG: GGDEF domain-containing protein [Firmicutes bacterium]|nr:GGDEF domain-containing protein [Bacillota bacterium]